MVEESGFGVTFPNYIVDVQKDEDGKYTEAIQFQCLERGGVRIFEVGHRGSSNVLSSNALSSNALSSNAETMSLTLTATRTLSATLTSHPLTLSPSHPPS